MSLKLVIPRDALIFRDGKPFTAVPGERSKSLPFPYPSTLAGAIRTRQGTKPDGEFDKNQIADLMKISVRGPILVVLDEDNKISNWYFPAPADALIVLEEDTPTRYALAPLDISSNRVSNVDENLKLIGAIENIKAKPISKPPLYWTWEALRKWLLEPTPKEVVDSETLGIHGPARDTRTHVSIEPSTQTALPGALFQTSGMEFTQLKRKEQFSPPLKDARRLALAVETEATFSNSVGFLGGERRIINWESSDERLPDCPQDIKGKIKESGHCRLVLATPAYFEEGYLSKDFEIKNKVKVQAVALPRYQTISGWDYDVQKPKPTRRLVPAGSVYFIKFEDKSLIENFVNKVWLHSISDDEQSQRDGFGLALLGTWNGQLRKMEVKHG